MSAAFDSNVTITIEIAPGSGPLDASPTWQDITSYGRAVEIDRGRASVLDRFDAGTATLVLDNRDGRFSPDNSQSPYHPNITSGVPVRVRAEYDSTTYELFRGAVERWPVIYLHKGKDAVVRIPCVDGFKLLAQHELSGETYSLEASDSRIGAVLDDVGWPAGLRDLDDGLGNVQAFEPDGLHAALSHIQDVADSEAGAVYVSAGGSLVFENRVAFSGGGTSQGTISPSAAPFSEVVPAFDDDFLYNEVRVTPEDGNQQRVVDATSVSASGRRIMTLDVMPNAHDAEALNIAEWFLEKFSEVRSRVDSLELRPRSSPSELWPHVLGRELRDVVTVEFSPLQGDQFSQDLSIQSIRHRFNVEREWTTTWSLYPLSTLETQEFWILGTSELGTGTRLA